MLLYTVLLDRVVLEGVVQVCVCVCAFLLRVVCKWLYVCLCVDVCVFAIVRLCGVCVCSLCACDCLVCVCLLGVRFRK